MQFFFQIRGDPVQKAEVRIRAASNEHQNRLQGQLQVRGPRKGRDERRVAAAAGRRILADRQVLPHLLSNPLLHIQHHLLASFHLVDGDL